MINLPDEVSNEQLVNLVHNFPVPFRGEDSPSLLDWFSFEVYLQAILDGAC